MKQVTFGMSGLSSATPQQIKTLYRVIMFLSGLWVTVIQPQFHFTPEVEAAVNKWILVGNTGIYYICQFFGWSDKDNGATTN